MEYLDSLIKEIKREIDCENTSVVSFDIFDTLVLRPAIFHEDIIRFSTRIMESEYNLELTDDRLKADKELRDPYATINDIWNHIVKKKNIAPALSQTFADIELKVEQGLLCCRRLGKELYDYAEKTGKRIIAISDMYISSRELRKTLSQLGYDKIEAVYVSCECKAIKRDASLYGMVLQAEGLLDPSKCVHIGDSHKGDLYAPSTVGIRAFCLPKNRDLFRVRFPKLFSAEKKGTLCERLILGFAANHFVEETYTSDKQREGLEYAAFLTFPILIFTTLFLLLTPGIQYSGDYSTIYFLSRDGWLFFKAYEILRDFLPGSVMKGFYLYGSRIACRCLAERESEKMATARWIPEGCTLSELIQAEVIDSEVRRAVFQTMPKSYLEIDVKTNKDKCITVLKESSHLFQKEHAERVYAAKRYYGEVFGTAQRVLIMDCGFCGTIAAYLSRGFNNQIQIDKVFLWENEKNRLLDDVLGTVTFTVFDQKKGHGLGPLVEAIFSKLNGSCLGFKVEDGSVCPVFEVFSPSNKMIEKHSFLQDESLEMVHSFGKQFSPFLSAFTVEHPTMLMDIILLMSEMNAANPSVLNDICFPETLRGKKQQKSVGETLRTRFEFGSTDYI